jgi:hypothetical protein
MAKSAQQTPKTALNPTITSSKILDTLVQKIFVGLCLERGQLFEADTLKTAGTFENALRESTLNHPQPILRSLSATETEQLSTLIA